MSSVQCAHQEFSMNERSAVRVRCAILLVLAVPAHRALAQNQNGGHWIATWASAQQQGRGAGPARGGAPPAAAAAGLPAAPAARPAAPPPAPAATVLHDQTVRMIVHTSIGGRRVRVQLSNAYGIVPLEIGAAHVALRSHDSDIVPESDRPLLFDGHASVMIPPGVAMVSDPVDLVSPALGDLAVSIFVPGEAALNSGHSLALHTTYIGNAGDTTGAMTMADATVSQAWYWLASVDVLAPASAGT